MNRKAQVGTTITWVVATLIIVVVLGISVLATFSFSNEKTVFFPDKKKDIIATKSITNFLRNQENVGLLESKNYAIFEERMKSFLETPQNITVDDFELYEGNEKKIKISVYRLRTSPTTFHFETDILFGQLKLKFLSLCRERCR